MGDYTVLSGKVQIKPELIEKLRPRFTPNESNDNSFDVMWMSDWKDLDLPEEIKNTVAFRTLAHPCSRGDWTPGCNSYGDDEPKMQYSESGLLEFTAAHKNHPSNSLNAFIALLPHIASSWDVELDRSDWCYEDEGAIKTFNSSTEPTLAKEIEDFEKYAWISSKRFLFYENKNVVSGILQRVGNYGTSAVVKYKLLHILRTHAGITGVISVPTDYAGNGLPMAIMRENSDNKRMVMIVAIDHEADTISVVFPRFNSGAPYVFSLRPAGGNQSIANPEHDLITYAKQYIEHGTLPVVPQPTKEN